MSYYLRAEDANGYLMMGTEIGHSDNPDDTRLVVEGYIERLGLGPGDKLKLYDLGNPTTTYVIPETDNDSSERPDEEGTGDQADGQVRGTE